MEVFEAIKARKSVKKFTDKMPSEADIQAIVDAGRLAPSGMNKQTWQFLVVTNKEWLKEVNDILKVKLERGNDYVCYYGAPVLIVVSANPAYHTSEADCASALENMYLAATALGIGACWINQLGKDNCNYIMPQLLSAGMPSGNLVYGSLALGYPPENYFRNPRPLAENTVKWYK